MTFIICAVIIVGVLIILRICKDEGNVLVDNCDGFCYIGHTYRKIKIGSRRKFGVLVGVIAYNVYKDAFLDEILETVKENGKPITKAQFRSIQGFSR